MIEIPEEVRGRRIVLRRPVEADIDELLALNRASVAHHLPWTPAPTTRLAVALFVERARREATASYLIRHADTDAILGVVTLSQIVQANFQSAYLGYNIGAPWARQGYMTEAITSILDLAFGAFGLHRVEANIQPGNEASIELVRRLGFRLEGFSPRYLKIGEVWCDHERWAILADEWAARARPAGGGEASSAAGTP